MTAISSSLPKPTPIRKESAPAGSIQKGQKPLSPPTFERWKGSPYLSGKFRPYRPLIEMTILLSDVIRTKRGSWSDQKMVRWKTSSDCLGTGAFSKVFKGKDKLTGKSVAMKEYKERPNRQEEQALINVWNQIPHAIHSYGILPLYDATVLVMDLAPSTLDKFINSTFSFEQVIAVARQLLEMHKAASKKGYVHGDLKPDNLGWDPVKNRLWVFDFGSSHQPHKEKRLQGALGYRDPVAWFEKKSSLSSDLWSIGCILYECFTRRRFINTDAYSSGSTSKNILSEIVKQIGPPPDGSPWKKHCLSAPLPNPQLQSWIRSVPLLSAQLSSEQIELFLQLLTGMLKWEDRLKPEEALALCNRITASPKAAS